MKKSIVAAVMALCLLAGTSAFAQDAKTAPIHKETWTPEQMAQKKTDKMTEALKLDKKQSKQLYEYNLEQVKKMQSKKEQMHADRKAEAEKMKGILTPEQFTQWEQMQSERMNKRGGPGHKDGKGMGGHHKDGKGGHHKDAKPDAPKPEAKK